MKKIFTTLLALLAIGVVAAAPISEQQARRIASDFFSKGTRSTAVEVKLEWSGRTLQSGMIQRSAASSSSDALIYIYNREDQNGFVIVSGDDKARPIIAFSDEQAFDITDMAPATREILAAWCKQIEAVSNGSSPSQKYSTNPGSVVCSYDTALWNQYKPYNNEAPIFNGERSLTGCVATAMSIIAYYHRWPEQGYGTTPAYSYEYNGISTTIPSNTLGRKYDYSNMLTTYSNGYTSAQGAAVAALMKDMGTSVQMKYSPSASGAISNMVPRALSTYFSYSKDALAVSRGTYSESEWNAILKENLTKYGPTYYSASSSSGGHAFILDGFTSEDYFHINYGWGGSDNGYYWLPQNEYNLYQIAILYLEPDRDGTSKYKDYLHFITATFSDKLCYGLATNEVKYVKNQSFKIWMGGISNNGNTIFIGDIMLAVCDKDYNIKEQLVTFYHSGLETDYYHWRTRTVKITNDIIEGDRLCLFYKGQYSDDWTMIKGRDEESIDELHICATPEQVAKGLSIWYDKQTKQFVFTSKNPIQYEVKSVKSGATLLSGSTPMTTETPIDLSGLEAGEYHFEFASGGRPYVLTVVL